MFVCIHYNRKATKIYKYVDMNIFGILYKMYVAKKSLSFIMKADTFFKVSFVTLYKMYLVFIILFVIVYYVTSLYLALHHLNFLYLLPSALALRFGIFYSNLSRKG